MALQYGSARLGMHTVSHSAYTFRATVHDIAMLLSDALTRGLPFCESRSVMQRKVPAIALYFQTRFA